VSAADAILYEADSVDRGFGRQPARSIARARERLGSEMTIAATRGSGGRLHLPAVAAGALGFGPVAYLALQDGGYDAVGRGQIGIVTWWVVLIAAVAGLAPTRMGRPAWIALALLAGFTLWTGASIGHAESAERAVTELSRAATYLGVLVLACAVSARTEPRHMVTGVACAIALVTVLAVASRLQPTWFPHNDQLDFLPAAVGQLGYPLNYWNLLAGLTAMGVPLLLGIAVSGYAPALRAAAAGTLPIAALCLYLTSSRGGVLALVLGVGVMLLLAPRRSALLAAVAVACAGAAVLVAVAAGQHALRAGTPSAVAMSQGDRLSVIAVAVVVAVGILHLAVERAGRRLRMSSRIAPPPRPLIASLVIVAVLAVGAAATVGLGGQARQLARVPDTTTADAATNSPLDIRYRFWQASLDALRTQPLRGIGAGSFEFWWARNGTGEGQFRDAHSLYFENLAELGVIGFALIAGFVLWVLGAAAMRTRRAPPEARMWLAAATGGLVVFAVTAGIEWAWEMAVLPVTAMLLVAATLAGRPHGAAPARVAPLPVRAGAAAVAVAALIAIAIPVAGAVALQDSRAAVDAGRLKDAIGDARTAERLQPYAATPKLQRALVLEQLGRLDAAAGAAATATADEPTNWRAWLVRARIDAERGRARAAVHELERSRSLNPRFTPFGHS
jgi:O-antigen ligase